MTTPTTPRTWTEAELHRRDAILSSYARKAHRRLRRYRVVAALLRWIR
jgi:hypothetical protein